MSKIQLRMDFGPFLGSWPPKDLLSVTRNVNFASCIRDLKHDSLVTPEEQQFIFLRPRFHQCDNSCPEKIDIYKLTAAVHKKHKSRFSHSVTHNGLPGSLSVLPFLIGISTGLAKRTHLSLLWNKAALKTCAST